MSDAGDWVKIERRFDASMQQVWDMWTQPDLFKQWYGPTGMSVPTADMDLTVGGTRKIAMEMTSPERTMTMWFVGVYKEVTAPRRLVYTESMCDADGTIIPADSMGMPPGHPDVTEVIIELREADGQTLMTMVHVGIPDGSPAGGGWGQAFDKLAGLLA